jgi:hypothetical protein
MRRLTTNLLTKFKFPFLNHNSIFKSPIHVSVATSLLLCFAPQDIVSLRSSEFHISPVIAILVSSHFL